MVAALLTATAQAQQGLSLSFYANQDATGLVDPLSNLLALTPTWTSNYTGAINYPTVSTGLGLSQSQNYTLLWTGWFVPPIAGTYTFQTGSDDGSMIYIDQNGDGTFSSASPDERVVNNNFFQGTQWRSGTVTLSAQPYRIAIAYYQGGGGEEMHAQYELSGSSTWLNVDTASGCFLLNPPGPPIIRNLGVTNVEATAATMQGALVSTGSSAVVVSVLWGTIDGGTNGSWANTNSWPVGTWGVGGNPSTNITGMTADQDYYYTFSGQNDSGIDTAAPSQHFITGALSVEATKDTGRASVGDTVVFTVSRPASCTNEALPVYYTLGGTAANGTHYSISPASGGQVLAAGQTTGTIVVLPVYRNDIERTVVLTLAPGPYAVGAPTAATGTLAAVTGVAYTYTWDGSSADWTTVSHWSGGLSGFLPANGSTGIIATGTAQINDPGNLYNPANGETPPAGILIQTGGTLVYNRSGASSILDHNFVLDGGTFMGIPRLYANCEYDHDLAVKSPSVVDVTQDAWGNTAPFQLLGQVKDYDATHTGQLTAHMGNANSFGLYGANAPFTAGWNITGVGTVVAGAPGALGTGNITVGSGGTVGWASGDDYNMPTITIGSGASLSFGLTGNYGSAPGKTITIQDGGRIDTMANDWQDFYVDAPLAISGSVTFSVDNRRQSLTFTNDIVNVGPTTITRGGYFNNEDHGFSVGKKNNAYTGDWLVVGPTLTALNDDALGTGSVDLRPGTVLSLGKDLTLCNMILGGGTAGSGGRTLTLQPCYRNAILTDAGVAPGTNVLSLAGTLAVAGNLTFTNLPDYDSLGLGHDACCKVKFVMQVDPSTGVSTDSVLQVSGSLNRLANADLVVTTQPGFPVGTYTVITAANDLSAQTFHSVTFNGQSAGVQYLYGAVELVYTASAPLVINAPTVSFSATKAAFAGNLLSTGTAATAVSVYYGQTDGGTNAAAWASHADLGVLPTGPFTAPVSGLQAASVYYYRCFVSNAAGGEWAPATSLILTPEDVSGYNHRLKVTFSGYTRPETLTNFPALVVFNEGIPGFKYGGFASPNGYDLRFSNAGGTKTLPYEIDTWNPASNSCVWVQLDALAGTNTFIWAYYGNAAAAGAPALYTTNGATWSDGYVGVWHMNQTNALDSTANRNNGISLSNTNVPQGFIGNAQGFNGSAGIRCPTSASFDTITNGVTISTWVYLRNSGNYPMVFTRGQDRLEVRFNQGSRQLEMEAPADLVANGTDAMALGTWHYAAGTYDKSAAIERLLIDGQVVNASGPNNAMNNAGYDVYLGRRLDGYNLDGLLDEMRVEHVARSTNWIWACYMNMASNAQFATYANAPLAKGMLLIVR
jgi:hypothetical protein